jgi:hypothetical protein
MKRQTLDEISLELAQLFTKETMNEIELKKLAYQIAEETPRHLDQPTSPPLKWLVVGDQIRVLLADGRSIRAPMPAVKKQVDKVTALPVHPPAKKKAGRIN